MSPVPQNGTLKSVWIYNIQLVHKEGCFQEWVLKVYMIRECIQRMICKVTSDKQMKAEQGISIDSDLFYVSYSSNPNVQT